MNKDEITTANRYLDEIKELKKMNEKAFLKFTNEFNGGGSHTILEIPSDFHAGCAIEDTKNMHMRYSVEAARAAFNAVMHTEIKNTIRVIEQKLQDMGVEDAE